MQGGFLLWEESRAEYEVNIGAGYQKNLNAPFFDTDWNVCAGSSSESWTHYQAPNRVTLGFNQHVESFYSGEDLVRGRLLSYRKEIVE